MAEEPSHSPSIGATVVVWKLDRLSRRLPEGVNLLAHWCEYGVRVVVITRQLDLSGAVGRSSGQHRRDWRLQGW